MSCRHVLQRLVLVFSGTEQQIWILLVKGTNSYFCIKSKHTGDVGPASVQKHKEAEA